MDTVGRIFDLVDKQFSEQREFARAIEVTPSIVSQWRNGITRSYERRLPQIAEVLGTTVEYLLTGENKAPAGQEADGLTEYDIRLLEWFRSLPEEKRRAILEIGGGPKE